MTCRVAAACTIAVLACLAAAPVPDDLGTEAGLRRALDAIEARYEAACRRVGTAVWQRWSGAEAWTDTAEDGAWQELSDVYKDTLLEAVISKWALRSTMTRDPTLMRRVRLWHTTRQAAVWTLDPEARRLARDLSRRLMGFAHAIDGRRVARSELLEALRASPDRDRRRAAWRELGRASSALRHDLHRLIRLRAVRALDTRSGRVARLVIEAEQIEPTWLFDLVNGLGGRTQPAFDALLAGMREALRVDRLEPWDLDHALEARSRARWGGAPAVDLAQGEGAATAVRRVMERAGIAATPVVSRDLPLPFLLAPASIPDDVRLLVDPKAAAAQALRAAIRAQLAARVSHGSPLLKGYPWLPTARSGVYDEGMGAAGEAFLHDPEVLARWMGLPSRDAERLQQDMKERALLSFRRTLLEEAFEYAIYVNPDADLESRYRELFRNATGTAIPASDPVDWPGNLAWIEAPMSSVGRLLGPALAANVHARMRQDLGDRRLEPGEAGRWLADRCLGDGERLPLGERLSVCTDRGYDTKALFDWMGVTAALAAPRGDR